MEGPGGEQGQQRRRGAGVDEGAGVPQRGLRVLGSTRGTETKGCGGRLRRGRSL